MSRVTARAPCGRLPDGMVPQRREVWNCATLPVSTFSRSYNNLGITRKAWRRTVTSLPFRKQTKRTIKRAGFPTHSPALSQSSKTDDRMKPSNGHACASSKQEEPETVQNAAKIGTNALGRNHLRLQQQGLFHIAPRHGTDWIGSISKLGNRCSETLVGQRAHLPTLSQHYGNQGASSAE